jgi:MFS family permease
VFAVFSSAWVVPGLIGPAASSAIAGAFGWRAVFLALLPFVAVAAVITLPALTRVAAPVDGATAAEAPGRAGGRAAAVALTLGVAAVLVALNGPPLPVAVALGTIGAPVAVRAFLRIVPAGTLRLAPGIPAAIAVKGILTFAFFGADAYVSLTFQEVRDQATWVAGAALTSATVAWTAAAWVQERVIHRTGPRWLVRRGLLLVAVGIAGMVAVLGSLPIPLAVPVWGVAGFGIGLAYSPISVTVLGLAEAGREGAASASVQLCDVLGVALGTGAAGALVALGDAQAWAPRRALELAFALTAVVAVLGAVAARRLPTALPP